MDKVLIAITGSADEKRAYWNKRFLPRAMRISSMAKRFLFGRLLFDLAWACFHELTPEQKDNDDAEQQINGGKRGKW
jgi:hypothetical protein